MILKRYLLIKKQNLFFHFTWRITFKHSALNSLTENTGTQPGEAVIVTSQFAFNGSFGGANPYIRWLSTSNACPSGNWLISKEEPQNEVPETKTK